MIKRIILLALVGFAQYTCAAPLITPPTTPTIPGVADGIAFANGIVSTSPSQIVNPSAVNATAWSNTATPTAVPTNLGAFSSPSTSNSTYNSATSLGLTGIGLQTQSNCANYVSGTNPTMDQQCAAVNFMSNNCLSLTPAEKSVLGSVPMASAGNKNCSGTYGQGASQFNFGNQVTSADPIFSGFNNAASTAASNQSGCTKQTVVTTPAQNQTETCIVSSSTSAMGCSQVLSTAVIPGVATCNITSGLIPIIFSTKAYKPYRSCSGLGRQTWCTWHNGAATSTTEYNLQYGCSQNNTAATVSVTRAPAMQCHSYGCNSNYYPLTLTFTPGKSAGPVGGNLAVDYQGFSWLGVTLLYDGPSNTVYVNSATPTCNPGWSCPAASYSGSLYVTPIIVTSSWVDSCTPFETSAGNVLPTP